MTAADYCSIAEHFGFRSIDSESAECHSGYSFDSHFVESDYSSGSDSSFAVAAAVVARAVSVREGFECWFQVSSELLVRHQLFIFVNFVRVRMFC